MAEPSTNAAQPSDGGQAAGTGFREALDKVPTATLVFMALNLAVFAVQSFVTFNLTDFSIATYPVIYGNQWYRIITSAFLHGGIMHIGMNMMSFYAMGAGVEKTVGSLKFFLLLWWFVLLGGLLYVGVCWGLAFAPGQDISWLQYNSVGFSGVLFSLAVIETSLSQTSHRSVFGMVRVPTKYYPWVLLVLISVLMPNISFVGHLCGLLVGLLYSRGFLNAVIPSDEAFVKLEGLDVMARVKQHPGFVSQTPQTSADDVNAAMAAAFAMAMMVQQQQQQQQQQAGGHPQQGRTLGGGPATNV